MVIEAPSDELLSMENDFTSFCACQKIHLNISVPRKYYGSNEGLRHEKSASKKPCFPVRGIRRLSYSKMNSVVI